MKPVIDMSDVFVDPRADEVGRLLAAADAHETWTEERHELIDAARKAMEKRKHVRFFSDRRLYRLHYGGTSFLYKVPENKRGYLSLFRGRLIRLVCLASVYRNSCAYIAAEYEDLKAPLTPYGRNPIW